MKNIQDITLIIVGSFGFMDIGDEAMLTEDLDYIVHHLGIARENIYLFGGDPHYISHYHHHPRENCMASSILQSEYQAIPESWAKKLKSSLKYLLRLQPPKTPTSPDKEKALSISHQCDVVLVTGGGTINTRDTHGRSLIRMHAIISYFKQLHKPIFMSGQTIGPLGLYKTHDKLAQDIIHSIQYLTVRDCYYSRRYLNAISAEPKELIETFDDAYTLPYQQVNLPPEINEFMIDRDTFAINVTEYTSDLPQQREFMATLCEGLIKSYSVNLIFVSHTPKDYYNLNIIRDMMNNHLKEYVLLPDIRLWKDRQLKKLISCCKVAIGGRYHFIVFAGTSNTPFVGMCGNHYSYIKQDGFARVLGLEDFILTEKETWNMELIHKKIKQALETKLNLEAKFQRPSISMQHFGRWLINQT